MLVKNSYITLIHIFIFLLCHFACVQKNAIVAIDDYGWLPTENETILKRSIASRPVVVIIATDDDEFQYYESVSF